MESILPTHQGEAPVRHPIPVHIQDVKEHFLVAFARGTMVNPEYWIHDDIVLKPATSMIVEVALKARLHVFLRCRAVELPYVSENTIPKCGHLHTTKGASVPTIRACDLAYIPTRPGQLCLTTILLGHHRKTSHP